MSLKNSPEYWTWKESASIEPLLERARKFPTEYFEHLKEGSLIEAGCGDGIFVFYLADRFTRIVGLDFNEETIKNNRTMLSRYPKYSASITFKVGDVLDIPYQPDYFDNYMSMGVIEHFKAEDQSRIAKEAYRILKKGGIAFIFVPYKYSIWTFFRTLYSRLSPGKWVYQKNMSAKKVKKLFESSGFKTNHVSTQGLFESFDNSFFISSKRIKNMPNPLYFFMPIIKKAFMMLERFVPNFGYRLIYIGEKK